MRKEPARNKRIGTTAWSREHWLLAILALAYAGMFISGLAAGDWVTLRDSRESPDISTAAPTLFLPAGTPAADTQVTSDLTEKPHRKLDINDADAWMLTAIPGVGEALADRIIEYRDDLDGFVTMEELLRVSGVGEKLYATLCGYLEVRMQDDDL